MWYNIMMTIGILLMLWSGYRIKKTISFLKQGERTTATVVRMRTEKDSDGESRFPVFSYMTSTKEEHTYEYMVSTNPASWEVGDKGTIVYDPANPSSARLITYFGIFGWPIVLLATAAPLVVIGVGYHLFRLIVK